MTTNKKNKKVKTLTLAELAEQHTLVEIWGQGEPHLWFSEDGIKPIEPSHFTMNGIFLDLNTSREFFLHRNKFKRESLQRKVIIHDPFKINNLMHRDLKNNLNFAHEIVALQPDMIYFFDDSVKRDHELINIYLKNYYEVEPYWSDPFDEPEHNLLPDNRLPFCYLTTKKYPEYQNCIGNELRERLGGLSIIEYVDRMKFYLKVKKQLANKEKVSKSIKI